MIKLILLLLLAFGAFMALMLFLPGSATTAFSVAGHAIPWVALGVCLVGYTGYKVMK